jgi:hypothetical protein
VDFLVVDFLVVDFLVACVFFPYGIYNLIKYFLLNIFIKLIHYIIQ